MSKERPSYLQNGQTESEREELKKQLQDSPTAVLSVCRLSLEQSLQKASALRAELFETRQKVFEILSDMIVAAQTASERLPRSVGFFVSEEDRQRTLLCTVRFLGALDPSVASMRRLLFHLLSAAEAVREALGSFLQAERHLFALVNVAEASARQEAEAMLAQLREEREAFDALSRDREELCALLQRFCGDILPSLSKELSFHADLEHEGNESSVARVQNTLGMFRHTAEREQRQLLSLFSKMDQREQNTETPEQRRTE